MIELFGMALLPSAGDVVSELIKGAASELGKHVLKKALGVDCTHESCDERFHARICNHDHNSIECPNCHRVLIQFTNVCSTTLKKSGQIAHIGVRIGPTWHHRRAISQIQITGGEYLFVGLSGEEIVEKNYLRDYDSGTEFSVDNFRWRPDSDFCVKEMTLIGHSECIPQFYKQDGRLLAIDTELRSKYNDLICTERDIIRWQDDTLWHKMTDW